MSEDESTASCGCGCISLVFAVALIIALITLWSPLMDFCQRWLESH